jgi:citrate lyase beta subunit
MLNKCVTTKATLLVPDMEDSVPAEEKAKARVMIKDKLKFIREKTFSPNVVLTPRTNGITTGLF